MIILHFLCKNNFETIKHLTESWLMRGPWALLAGLRCAVLVGKYQVTALVLIKTTCHARLGN